MMRAVLDTNVVVSATLGSGSPPDLILRAWRDGRFDLIVSEALLNELERVLARPSILRRSGYTRGDAASFIEALADGAVLVETTEKVTVISADPDDNHLLEAAIAGNADYIVSGDKQVLDVGAFRGVRIVTPARFLAVLVAAGSP